MPSLKNHKYIPFLVLGFLVVTPLVTHANFLHEAMWGAVTGIFGMFLRIAGELLDYAINNFVIGFADEYTTSIGVAIDTGWALARDIMNLVFIFGLLYIGFKIILDSDSGQTRSLLARIILAALLVNFSLFISKFVVDASNALASQIAMSGFAEDNTPEQIMLANNVIVDRYQVDMASDMMTRLGINSIWNTNIVDPQQIDDWGYIFGTAFLLIVAAFVFAAGAVLLMIRYAVLSFYILLSPFMFIGWAFPPLARYTGMYWRSFLGRAFFAPIYFLFLYFSLQIITILSDSRNLSSFKENSYGDALLNNQVDSNSSLPFFFVAIVFLVFSLVAAQKLGADGGNLAVSTGKNWANKIRGQVQRGAGSATFGAAGWAGQKTIGKGADRLAQSSRFQTIASNSKLGEYLYRKNDKLADATFDARRVGGMGKSLGIGEGKKGGRRTRIKEAEKSATELNDMLKANMSTKTNQELKEDVEEKARRERLKNEGIIENKGVSDDKVRDRSERNKENIAEWQKGLDEGIKNKTFTAGDVKKFEDSIQKEKDDLIKNEETLAHRNSKEKLQKQIETLESTIVPGMDKQQNAAIRQNIEDLQKELSGVLELDSSLDEVDKDGNNVGLEKMQKRSLENEKLDIDALEKRHQRRYQEGLKSQADPGGFWDRVKKTGTVDPFPQQMLDAINKKENTSKEAQVQSKSAILAEVKKQLGPLKSMDKNAVKEAFSDALEENRMKTARLAAKKGRKDKEKKQNLDVIIKEITKQTGGSGTKSSESGDKKDGS